MSFVEKEFKNDDEINFKEILFVLWGSKILIAICIFEVSSNSLSIPNKFTSISLLKANDGIKSEGSNLDLIFGFSS